MAELWLRSRRASIPAIPAPLHDDEEVAIWVATLVIPTMECWVVDGDAGDLVALLALHDGWVDQLYVDPRHWDEGIGTQLIESAKCQCPDGLDLWTFQQNLRARTLYERHGFVAVGGTEVENEERAPALHYHWPATPAVEGPAVEGSAGRQPQSRAR